MQILLQTATIVIANFLSLLQQEVGLVQSAAESAFSLIEPHVCGCRHASRLAVESVGGQHGRAGPFAHERRVHAHVLVEQSELDARGVSPNDALP